MKPHAIRAILFDADGVVIHPQRQFSRHLAEVYGLLPEKTLGFFEGIFNQCLLGRAQLEDVLPPYLQEWAWPGSVDEFIATWMREDHNIDALLMTDIQRLRQRCYQCGLATLQERRRAAYMRREMHFDRFFDGLFFSCELGYMKTDAAFYTSIEQQLGLPGDAILFWDDSAANVEAARSSGWNAEVYTSLDDFREKIARYVKI